MAARKRSQAEEHYICKYCYLKQCSTASNVWKIYSTSTTIGTSGEVGVTRVTETADEVIGFMLIYVDDAMAIGPTPLVETVFDMYKSMWDVKVTGILVADGATTVHTVPLIRFLGCSLRRKGGIYTLDQIDYIEERLLERGYDKVAGKGISQMFKKGKPVQWIERIPATPRIC